MRQFWVYIMAGRSGTLYIGVTNDLKRRAWEHKNAQSLGFTARYNVNRLVYYETCTEPEAAIAREKQIKGYRRQKKLDLINSVNPRWDDLSV